MAPNIELIRTTFGIVVHNTNFQFSYVYLRRILSGSGTNQSDATLSNGQTDVNNWGIYDGVSPLANLITYGQAMHTSAGNWQNCFAMVFV
jgi:hypothetical protein